MPASVQRQLFNPKTGETALIDSADVGLFAVHELYLGKTRIGYANCSRKSASELLLSDIQIEEEEGTGGVKGTLLRLLGRQATRRRQGWGSLLLQYVIEDARRKRYKAITAEVNEADRAANHALLEWYGKYGFRPCREGSSIPGRVKLQLSLK